MIKSLKSNIITSIKNKKINIFLLFFLLAFIILIFTKLSKEYTNTIAFSIDKTNVPQEYVILNNSDSILNITLQTHGFKWLEYYLSKPKVTIDFIKDVNKNDSSFIWKKSIAYLNSTDEFGAQVNLVNISPERLVFKFDVNLVKKTPVYLNSNIKFSPGFDVSDAYNIEPDSVLVIGPKVVASKIDSIGTQMVNLTEVKSDINQEVMLKLPEGSNELIFSSPSVTLNAKVEKFTEGSLKIPVLIKNVPDSITIKHFPKFVNVIYYTSLKNFNDITAKDFKVECDYSKLENEQSFLIPELTKAPKFVKNVKINQQHIEFIITE